MARRNRKNRKQYSAGFMFPPSLAAVLVLAATLALAYLWLCGRCEAAGQRIKRLEAMRDRLRRERLVKEYNWQVIRSWPNLERILAQHGLNMDWPGPNRVIQVGSGAERASAGLEGTEERAILERTLRVAMND